MIPFYLQMWSFIWIWTSWKAYKNVIYARIFVLHKQTVSRAHELLTVFFDKKFSIFILNIFHKFTIKFKRFYNASDGFYGFYGTVIF